MGEGFGPPLFRHPIFLSKVSGKNLGGVQIFALAKICTPLKLWTKITSYFNACFGIILTSLFFRFIPFLG